MAICIRALTPALAKDYFDFFDDRAFTDGSPYAPCYCSEFHLSAAEEQAIYAAAGGDKEKLRLALRAGAEPMVAQGTIQGYLAYEDGVAVGWCNANDRQNYRRMGNFDFDTVLPLPLPKGERIKTVVCFEVAPTHRGRGIAAALLAQVCADAAAQGYTAVEGWAVLPMEGDPLAFTGPLRLYRAAGFVEVGRCGRTLHMQKRLQDG